MVGEGKFTGLINRPGFTLVITFTLFVSCVLCPGCDKVVSVISGLNVSFLTATSTDINHFVCLRRITIIHISICAKLCKALSSKPQSLFRIWEIFISLVGVAEFNCHSLFLSQTVFFPFSFSIHSPRLNYNSEQFTKGTKKQAFFEHY